MPPPPGFCRDCLARLTGAGSRCEACGSPRTVRHAEIWDLTIAHLDCDAFYATIEKRDRPELRDRPVIVGGGSRGVVAAACYTARLYGVRSAMPMFKALARCPDAAVVKPDMAKYAAVGREVRALMAGVTDRIEPLSIDEAFMDLSDTPARHGLPPSIACARLARDVERALGITISVGLSHNKFLAKLASDLDKPRGFAVIGRAETLDFLAPKPTRTIFGVGRAMAASLLSDGIRTIGDLRARDPHWLRRRHGAMGERLWHLAHGRDDRPVTPRQAAKSVSTETTLSQDLTTLDRLEEVLADLADGLALRLAKKSLQGRTVVLKLKTASFQLITRHHRLGAATAEAAVVYEAGRALLAAAADGTAFRLIGLGVTDLTAPDGLDLFAPGPGGEEDWAEMERPDDPDES